MAQRPTERGLRKNPQVTVVGTCFRHAGFARLARIARPAAALEDLAGLRAALGGGEAVPLVTCNRIEVYVAAADDAADPSALAQALASYLAARAPGEDAAGLADLFFVRRGREAVEHLFSVAASLDSLALGECQIGGQVRRALERAVEAGTAGPALRRAFERALRVAKRVRADTGIGRFPTSVASLCLRSIREHFGAEAPRRAVLVGVGDMTRKVAAALAERGTEIIFANRTLSKAEDLARRHGGRAVSLEALRAAPPERVDVIVSATSAPGTVIDRSTVAPAVAARRAARESGGDAPVAPLLLCDLAMPPDIDPRAVEDADGLARLVTLADLEAVARENRERLEGEVDRARVLVGEAVDRFLGAERVRDLGPELADVRALSREIAARTVEELLGSSFRAAGEAEREALRAFAQRLTDRVLHLPFERIRRLAEEVYPAS